MELSRIIGVLTVSTVCQARTRTRGIRRLPSRTVSQWIWSANSSLRRLQPEVDPVQLDCGTFDMMLSRTELSECHAVLVRRQRRPIVPSLEDELSALLGDGPLAAASAPAAPQSFAPAGRPSSKLVRPACAPNRIIPGSRKISLTCLQPLPRRLSRNIPRFSEAVQISKTDLWLENELESRTIGSRMPLPAFDRCTSAGRAVTRSGVRRQLFWMTRSDAPLAQVPRSGCRICRKRR